jgi:hypothetical protein
MHRLILVTAVALLAGSAANAAAPAPGHDLRKDAFQGSWACTIAQKPQTKLFLEIKGHVRAAFRDFPYYGQTNYLSYRVAKLTRGEIILRGVEAVIDLHREKDGVLVGVARTKQGALRLQCARG